MQAKVTTKGRSRCRRRCVTNYRPRVVIELNFLWKTITRWAFKKWGHLVPRRVARSSFWRRIKNILPESKRRPQWLQNLRLNTHRSSDGCLWYQPFTAPSTARRRPTMHTCRALYSSMYMRNYFLKVCHLQYLGISTVKTNRSFCRRF